MMDDSTRTLLRAPRYPPLHGDEAPYVPGAVAHEDINLLTVLPASNEPGLQVQDLDGNLFDVPCDFGSIAVNAGDMLQLASWRLLPIDDAPGAEPHRRGRHTVADRTAAVPPPSRRRGAGRRPDGGLPFLQERIAELRSQDLKPAP